VPATTTSAPTPVGTTQARGTAAATTDPTTGATSGVTVDVPAPDELSGTGADQEPLLGG
jgi:hypothetical protein